MSGVRALLLGAALLECEGEPIRFDTRKNLALAAYLAVTGETHTREAFALATDREMLADVTLNGYAFPATGGLVPPGMPGHSPGICPAYDPEGARHLLAEAGYPHGRGFPTIDRLARDDPGHDLLCGYLQAPWLENLGVETRWKEFEWGRFPDRMAEEILHL